MRKGGRYDQEDGRERHERGGDTGIGDTDGVERERNAEHGSYDGTNGDALHDGSVGIDRAHETPPFASRDDKSEEDEGGDGANLRSGEHVIALHALLGENISHRLTHGSHEGKGKGAAGDHEFVLAFAFTILALAKERQSDAKDHEDHGEQLVPEQALVKKEETEQGSDDRRKRHDEL